MSGLNPSGLDWWRAGEPLWIGAQLDRIPRQWRRRVRLEHGRRLSERDTLPEREFSIARRGQITEAAHTWLAEVVGVVESLRVPVDVTDAGLIEIAEANARECMNLAGASWLKTPEAIRARLARHVESFGIRAPAQARVTASGRPAGVEDGPAIARVTCPLWWRRKLRAVQARGLEAAAIRLGYVQRGREIYASDATVDRRAQQNKRNAATLAAMDAVNLDTGEVCRLDDLAAATVANPAIRRGELMTRISGFERVAAGLGHVAEFVTLTCPSAYHAQRIGRDGRTESNPAWAGHSPRDAQGYLTRLWANCRAALWRRGIRPYGFRIAEPHHDGAPHWHLLLFMEPMLDAGRSAVARFRAIFRRYALRQDGGEAGARKNRIKFIRIDACQGSAAGYVAKYVAKNIDGFQVQADLEGVPAVDGARRVAAWAATWGIRQFQQIGGPPVGVWRELRRMPADGGYSDVVEAARVAADVGPQSRAPGAESKAAEHWAAFVRIMGGPVAMRRDFPVRLAYTRPGERWDFVAATPCPANPTRYGETAAPAVYGVRDVARGRAWASERGRWEIGRGAGHKAALGAGDGSAVFLGGLARPRSPGNNCSRWVGEGGFRTMESWGRWRNEFERKGFEAEVRHGGGVEPSRRAHSAGCGDPADRRTGGNSCRVGGTGAENRGGPG